MVLCIAILAPDDPPLYFGCIPCDADKENDLRLFLYSSLDAFNEKAKDKKPQPHQELFLGSLFLNNRYKSYGYLTNTLVKFMVIVESVNQTNKEQDMRVLFRKIHNIYCKSIMNPFYVLGSPIQSRELDELLVQTQ